MSMSTCQLDIMKIINSLFSSRFPISQAMLYVCNNNTTSRKAINLKDKKTKTSHLLQFPPLTCINAGNLAVTIIGYSRHYSFRKEKPNSTIDK